jgi:adenine-specific DNA-methyltransferase
MCDEIFGRSQFLANVVWQKRISPDARLKLGDAHEHILVYTKNKDKAQLNKLPVSEKLRATYKNPDNDPRGAWVSSDYMAQGYRPNQMYEITTPSGKKYRPRDGSCWANIESVFHELVKDNRIWFGKNGDNIPRRKTFLSESDGNCAWSWWGNSEVGHTQEAKKEIKQLFNNEIFDTPKPERLIQRIISIASNENDIILDSFLGSGTTSAVAHKMGRRWIGIELGVHCDTHCLPRLKKVVSGTDQGGISKSVNWNGSGGFKYYYLAPSLLKKDGYDNWVIEPQYNAEMLAAAMAKHEGFNFQPDENIYWKQGKSTEKDFIYTTTSFVTVEMLDRIHEEMLPDESLLVSCKAFQEACLDRFQNITIKKIPNMLLGKCEFGKEDYSLNIINLPIERTEEEIEENEPEIGAELEENLETEQITLF